MNELIASFPSFKLYNNNLISSPLVATRTLLDLPACVEKIGENISDETRDTLEPTLVFFDTAGCEFYERNEGDDPGSGGLKKGMGEGSKSNANEAEVVVRWARKLVGGTGFAPHPVPFGSIHEIMPWAGKSQAYDG